MRFDSKITKHGNGHKVLVPGHVVKEGGLEDGDAVTVDIVPKKKETFCRKCIHSRDCWIKATMLGKKGHTMMDLSEMEQRIVIRASNNDCDLYEERGSE